MFLELSFLYFRKITFREQVGEVVNYVCFQDICDFICSRLKLTDNLETVCNEVIDTCLYKVSSPQNLQYTHYKNGSDDYRYRKTHIILNT